MKLIKNITINRSPMSSIGETRSFIVKGDPGAVFSVIVKNEDNHFYNFSEKLDKNNDLITDLAFTSTGASLNLKTILDNGEYVGFINFPIITDDDVYSIILIADEGSNTALDYNYFNSNPYVVSNIHKYKDTTVTFSLVSAGSSGNYSTLPDNVTSTGVSSSVIEKTVSTRLSISWAITLSSSQFVIARQPLISDFEFTTTKTSRTAGASTKSVEVTDITGLSIGMDISGTGIASGSIITTITPGYLNANKSSDFENVYVKPLTIATDVNNVQSLSNDTGGTITIDKASTFDAGITLTFTGKGSRNSKTFNNTAFSVKNFALTIDPVVTTTDAVVSNSATIPLASTNGIKAADTVLMTGVGVTAASPHVDAISAGVNITASSAQTLENGQTMTFTGSSRSATITADVTVLQFGKDDITLTLALDNILTVG